jgi:hypothetical protein
LDEEEENEWEDKQKVNACVDEPGSERERITGESHQVKTSSFHRTLLYGKAPLINPQMFTIPTPSAVAAWGHAERFWSGIAT